MDNDHHHEEHDIYMPEPFRIWVVIGSLIGLMLTVLLNSGNLYVLSTRKALFSPNLCLCLQVLAVADILGGIVCHVVPIIMAVDMQILISDRTACNIIASIIVMAVGLSQLILMVTTVDRYIAVSRPLAHRIYMTKKRIRLLLLTAIVTGVVISSLRSLHVGLAGYCDFGSGEFLRKSPPLALYDIIPSSIVLITTVLNVLVLRKARTRRPSNMSDDETSPGSTNEIWPRRASNFHGSRQMRQSFKGARTVATVVGASYLVWMPYILGTTIIALAKVEITVSEFYILHWIMYFTFWINPIIFIKTSRSYNKAVRDMLGLRHMNESDGTLPLRPDISLVDR